MLCVTDLANYIRDNYNPTLNVPCVINSDIVAMRIEAAYGIELNPYQSVVSQLKERGLYILKGFAKERKTYAAPMVFAIVAMQLHPTLLLPVMQNAPQLLCHERLDKTA